MPLVTIKEIAARAGMSVPTVSRILNRKEGFQVKDETRKRVINLAKEMGYQPNLAARSLRSGKRYTIAVAGTGYLAGMKDFYASLIYSGIGQVAERNGYYLSFISQGENYWDDLVRFARNRIADGFIIINYSSHYEYFVNTVVPMLHAEEVPFVAVHGTVRPYGCHNVGYDVRQAGYAGTRYLLNRGYRRIVLACQREPASDMLADGYRAAMDEAGYEPRVRGFDGKHTSARIGYEWARGILGADGPAEAYFVSHDFFAIGFEQALNEAGVRVPDDAGLLCCGDYLRDEQIVIPKFTSVARFPSERGARAAEMLFDAIDGTLPAGEWQRYIFQPELVERTSTR